MTIKNRHIINLASNENPHGMSPAAAEAIKLADAARYPNEMPLKRVLARTHKLDETNVILGNGSSELLNIIAQTFLGSQSEAISSQYAFVVYGRVTKMAKAKHTVIPAVNFGHDLPSIIGAITSRTKLLWLANPNNPTGTFISHSYLKACLLAVPRDVIIVLDEAYFEYLNPLERVDTTMWLVEFSNLIIVRTFSKAFGMAGLRVGYALASKRLIAALQKTSLPYGVNTVGLIAAEAALKDQTFIQKSYKANHEGMVQLKQGLSNIGIECLPASRGNFVTFKIANARSASQALLRCGVIVKWLFEYEMPDYIRVSVGTPIENDYFIHRLTLILYGK